MSTRNFNRTFRAQLDDLLIWRRDVLQYWIYRVLGLLSVIFALAIRKQRMMCQSLSAAAGKRALIL